MTAITTRAAKGSPLTNAEIDANFLELLSNKLELIVSSITSSATPTPASTDSQYNVTALATNATVGAPSGTPVEGSKLIIRIKDDGTARTLAWNAIYRDLLGLLPTTTVVGKTIYVGLVYNSTDSKWDVISVMVEV